MTVETRRELKIDDIVTVTSRDSLYYGKQGSVVEIEDDGDRDGPIGVRFHWRQAMHYVPQGEECVVRHERKELRIDSRWSVETRALLIYPSFYHSLAELRFEFDNRNPCMRAGCEKCAIKRCIINIFGSVIERDLCEDHAWMDGMIGEYFDTKEKYEPASPYRPSALLLKEA